MTSDHTPDGGAMDTRRIVVLDGEKCYCGHCGLDTTGTARQWARADRAPTRRRHPVASDAQGIPLWRFTHVHDECDPAEGECYATYEEYADEGGEPGTWQALDAASVAARREAIASVMYDAIYRALAPGYGLNPERAQDEADAVLKALGLGGDDA